jgi:hypothetical protein
VVANSKWRGCEEIERRERSKVGVEMEARETVYL